MAWTSPRTWVAGETTTAALFNTHIKDNLAFLKPSFDDNGKFRALSSSYLADLSGANLTGVSKPGGANTYTAGKQDMSACTLVLPVGTDKFDGTAGNKTAGSLWVEGNYLHWVDSSKVEWRFLGSATGATGKVAGSFWMDSTYVAPMYADSSGAVRLLQSSSTPHTDSSAARGSAWVDSTYLHVIVTTGGTEFQVHVDTHTDGTVHGDVSHTDTHSDSHTDNHGDVPHTDNHGDTYANHTDIGHADWHGDYTDTVAHTDTYSDTYSDTHGDVTHSDHSDHGDVAHDDRPESMGT